MIRKTTSQASEYKKTKFSIENCGDFFREHCPFLFNRSSLFYYGVLVFVIGILWMAYAIFLNNFSVLYGWDYSSQYVTMAYGFRDMWYDFFQTGSFPLYSFETFLGTDNIGSNSYYGLFDPFLLPALIFPREWMPQMFVLAALLKGVASAFAMRAFLIYLGVSDKSSRLGGVVFAFSGYLNFMVGFPSYLSMAFTLPLMLLGIEKVLKERKIITLVFAITLLGMISFFFLVVFLIFAALYTLWRFIETRNTRSWKQQFSAIGAGVFAVIIGLCCCSWVLLPSIRETSLSGRTNSIGGAYLEAITNAFKNQSATDLLALIFMPVGGNAGRAVQGLIGFFYPTCGYLWLPVAKLGTAYTYDSWTASLFCYTPITILFFMNLLHRLKEGKWASFAAFSCGVFLLLTNFSYYFFYAFAGDGYGRWYIVLVPLIILAATRELDVLKRERKSILIGGSLLTLLGTICSYVLVYFVLAERQIPLWIPDGYAGTIYEVPGSVSLKGYTVSLSWIVYYQIALVLIEGSLIVVLHHRKDLWKILLCFVVVEITISGNCSFFYGSMLSEKNWLGGENYYANSLSLFEEAYKDKEEDYYRAYSDANTDRNTNFAYGYNGTSHFHSLFNYDVASFARYSYITNNEGGHEAFGQDIITKSWSAYYANKRIGFDLAVGTRYYLIQNEGYTYGYDDFAPNVPFGSKLIGENETFRLYESPYALESSLGHKVEYIYEEGLQEGTRNYSNFFTNTASSRIASEVLRNEQVYLDGAIVKDDEVEEVLSLLQQEGDNRTLSEAPIASYSSAYLTSLANNITWRNIETRHDKQIEYGYFAVNEDLGINWDPGYFLTYLENNEASSPDSLNPVVSDKTFLSSSILVSDFGKAVAAPKNSSGYFNEDEEGAYFVLDMQLPQNSVAPRVYFIGDFDGNENGIIDEEEHNQVLCYDYKMLENWSYHSVRSGGDIFGFYVPGRCRYIVFCYKGTGTMTFQTPTIYMQERSSFEQNIDSVRGENALQNVKFHTDHFDFDTSYDRPELVVTTLGYDAGWSIQGEKEGEIYQPKIYCINGGLVGFVLPSGDWHWNLNYRTPTLNVSVALGMVGIASLGLYQLGAFLYQYKVSKKEVLEEDLKNPCKSQREN